MVVPQIDPDLRCLEALYHRRVSDVDDGEKESRCAGRSDLSMRAA